ncbi:hypothetical protein FOWG_07856 [Fusarium oxysporum f. sp. lycopersici MN25]|nr:hypothetical protein FOWG_07856 [Fusarium oxysporum f. sp. lycopersici MN25]
MLRCCRIGGSMYAISRFRCKSTMVVWICRVCATLTEYMAQKRDMRIGGGLPLQGLLIPMQTEISDNKPRPSLRYMTLTHRQNKICQARCPCDKHNGSKPAFSISPSTARPRVPDAFYLPGSSIGSIGPLISISMHAMLFSFGGYVRSVTLTRSHPPPLYLPG